MNAWLPQASYPCSNFSDTSSFKFRRSKGSIGHAFTVRIHTGNQNQTSFYPFIPHKISVLIELILGHLRYLLTDVPPQPNLPPDNIFQQMFSFEYLLLPPRSAQMAARALGFAATTRPSYSSRPGTYPDGQVQVACFNTIHFQGQLIRQVSYYKLLGKFRLP